MAAFLGNKSAGWEQPVRDAGRYAIGGLYE